MKERREENLNISDCRNGGNKMKQGEKRGTKKGRQKKREDEIPHKTDTHFLSFESVSCSGSNR